MGKTRLAVLFMALALILTASAHGRTGPGDPSPALQYDLIQKALERYTAILQNGGWSAIKAPKKYYMKGQTDPAILQIKQRLKASGDFLSDDTTNVFTDELVTAVQKVQKRFGYRESGVVDAQLVKQLNVPVQDRIRQLEANLERWQSAPVGTTGIRLVANIPEFKLHVYEGDEEVFDMAVVVGSQSNKTVLFSDEMTYLVFSPYWNVPPSIVQKEILPAMNKNPNYLQDHGYEQTGFENGLPVIRQRPGPGNSLGQVKFVFPNEHNIYFHDTPAKSLFDLPKRTFSHGCIRLAEPAKLAEYLLRDAPEWTPVKIREAMNSGKEQPVKLLAPAAVSIVYYTAWVDADGDVHFREDVYGLDKNAGYKVAVK